MYMTPDNITYVFANCTIQQLELIAGKPPTEAIQGEILNLIYCFMPARLQAHRYSIKSMLQKVAQNSKAFYLPKVSQEPWPIDAVEKILALGIASEYVTADTQIYFKENIWQDEPEILPLLPPDDTQVKAICKIGQRELCCRYLTAGAQGFSCAKFTINKSVIDDRVAQGQYTSKGDNCPGKGETVDNR